VRFGQDGKPFVYRIAGGELEQVPVTVGVIDEARSLVEIKDGVQVGDQVVVGNVGTLGRGMKAQVIGNERGSAPGGARGGEARDGGSPGKAVPGKAGPGKAAPDSVTRTKRGTKPDA
jgi:hypothetical protein